MAFIILYMWRKISNLESLLYILEKRVNNKNISNCNKSACCPIPEINKFTNNEYFKNDNIAYSDNTQIDCKEINDIIMNEVFNCGKENIVELPVAKHDYIKIEEDVKPPPQISQSKEQELSNDIIDDIIEDKILSETKNKDDEFSVSSDKETLSRKKLIKLSLDNLKELCQMYTLSNEGTKPQLIERLLSK